MIEQSLTTHIFHERPLRIDKFTYDAGGEGSTGLFGLVSMTVKSKNMFHLTSGKPTKRHNMDVTLFLQFKDRQSYLIKFAAFISQINFTSMISETIINRPYPGIPKCGLSFLCYQNYHVDTESFLVIIDLKISK